MAMMMIMIFQVRSTCIALFLFIMNLFGGNLPVIVAPLRQDFDDDGDGDDYEMLMMVVMMMIMMMMVNMVVTMMMMMSDDD